MWVLGWPRREAVVVGLERLCGEPGDRAWEMMLKKEGGSEDTGHFTWDRYKELGRVRQTRNGSEGQREQDPSPLGWPDCPPRPQRW